jgi:hypothetical protein
MIDKNESKKHINIRILLLITSGVIGLLIILVWSAQKLDIGMKRFHSAFDTFQSMYNIQRLPHAQRHFTDEDAIKIKDSLPKDDMNVCIEYCYGCGECWQYAGEMNKKLPNYGINVNLFEYKKFDYTKNTNVRFYIKRQFHRNSIFRDCYIVIEIRPYPDSVTTK